MQKDKIYYKASTSVEMELILLFMYNLLISIKIMSNIFMLKIWALCSTIAISKNLYNFNIKDAFNTETFEE